MTVRIVTAVFVLGAVACSLSPSVQVLIAARVFLGFAVGGATQVVPIYISKLAPARRRGNMVTMFNVAIGVGEAADILCRVRSSREGIRGEAHEIHDVARRTDPENKGWHGIAQLWMRPALVAALGVAFFTQF